MARQDPFVARCLFLLSCLGPVEARRMFGGHGLFLDGRMLALIAGDRLFLKVDGETRSAFAAAGSSAFTYRRKGKAVALSYWRAPDQAMAGPAAMGPWAERAAGAAARAARSKRARGRPRRDEPRLAAARRQP